MGIIEELVANPGLYLGIDTVAERGLSGAARIVVTTLPGGASVSLDYEIFNTVNPDMVRGHVEHTVIGRTADGGGVMVVAAPHSKSVHVMRETADGVFEVVGDESSPYPAKVVISFPEPGTLQHSWSYGAPGDEPIERDVTVAKRQ